MKKNIVLLCIILTGITAQSQSKEDYSKIVDIITKSYNTQDTTLVANHYDQTLKDTIIERKKNAFVAEDAPEIIDFDHSTNGKIIETELIMNDTDGNVYYVQFENDAKILTVALSKEKEITALQLEDY